MCRVSGVMVCTGFLRTQQRAKSQCIKHIPRLGAGVFGRGFLDGDFLAMDALPVWGELLSWLLLGGP